MFSQAMKSLYQTIFPKPRPPVEELKNIYEQAKYEQAKKEDSETTPEEKIQNIIEDVKGARSQISTGAILQKEIDKEVAAAPENLAPYYKHVIAEQKIYKEVVGEEAATNHPYVKKTYHGF